MTTSKFNDELAAALVAALKDNPSLTSAATKVGITPSTLSRWLQLGSEGDPVYAQFAVDAAEARSHLKDEVVAALRVTACDPVHPQQTRAEQIVPGKVSFVSQQTRAARELLSSQYPHEFRAAAPEPEKKADPEETLDPNWLPTDELRTLARLLEKVQLGKVEWEKKQRERKGASRLVDELEPKKNGRS